MTGRQEIAEHNPGGDILVPPSKWNASADEIYQDALFQILNPLVQIPAEYCKHYRKRVMSFPSGAESIMCIQCGVNIK
jgi:hypothetical protein